MILFLINLNLFLNLLLNTNSTNIINNKLNTLKYYAVILSHKYNSKKDIYTVNGNKISRRRYLKYKKKWDNLGKCTPCWLKAYDENNFFLYEGYSYKDCFIGPYIERYTNKNVKIQGNYKAFYGTDFNGLFTKGYCKKDGVWKYYDKHGKLIKEEKYKDGIFVE